MTALGTTTSEHETAALGAGANEETVRADTLDLGGLIGTLGSHDVSFVSREKPGLGGNDRPSGDEESREVALGHSDAFLLVSNTP